MKELELDFRTGCFCFASFLANDLSLPSHGEKKTANIG
jgi:hypothetical protein